MCIIITHVTVNGEALQMHAVYKKPYFYYKLSNDLYQYYKLRKNLYQYYKLRKNLYQVLQVMRAASEHAMIMKSKVLYDKIIITIASTKLY